MVTGRTILAAPAALAAVATPGASRAATGAWRRTVNLPWPAQEVYGAALYGQAVPVGGMVVRGNVSAPGAA